MLGYIRGERYSLAVDAGNSRRHVEKFYAALDAAELRRPDFTVLTHWHWDHTSASPDSRERNCVLILPMMLI